MGKRTILSGNDIFMEIESKISQDIFQATYWDLWLSILLVNRFETDWSALVSHLESNYKHINRRNHEAMLSHIHKLIKTLENNGLSAMDIVQICDKDILKKQEKKAQTKIIGLTFRDKEKSPWMNITPRKTLFNKAMRGRWDSFPINPSQFTQPLEKFFGKKSFVTKSSVSSLVNSLNKYIETQEKKLCNQGFFSLYRAFLTVIVENINSVDDSYGMIGDLSKEVLDKYIQLKWKDIFLNTKVYLEDLLSYFVWEDYGITNDRYPVIFEGLAVSDLVTIENILIPMRKELSENRLEYQAEKALTIFGWMCTTNELYEKFPSLAAEMGARYWERILIMSDLAEKKGKIQLADNVLKTAIDSGGLHKDYIEEKYQEFMSRVK